MDALLLLVPQARALGHKGMGDFHMDRAGRIRRRERSHVAPFVFTGIQIVSKRLLRDAPEGPFSTNILWDRAIEDGRCLRRGAPGPVVRRRHAAVDPVDGSGARECLTRQRVAVYTIPSHRSFADALAAGLIARFGKDPLGLAQGRILLPNNRAVRAVTEAFVRASGSGLSAAAARSDRRSGARRARRRRARR